MHFVMTNGSESKTCFPANLVMSASPPTTIAASSRRCSTDTGPEFRGAICPNGLATGRIRTGGSAAGLIKGCGSASSSTWPPNPTTNMRCLTAPSCAPTSTAPAPPKKDDDQAIGRSKGGLSTKIHALVDALGNPLRFLLTPAQTHDLTGADALLPQMTADLLIADKAYDADERVIAPLTADGKATVIPPRQNRTAPRQFDQELYKERHLIENFFCKLKQFRAIATRYDKTARNFLAAIHLAAATIWLNRRHADPRLRAAERLLDVFEPQLRLVRIDRLRPTPVLRSQQLPDHQRQLVDLGI